MNPDTKTTVDALKALSAGIRSEVAGRTAQADAIDLAVSQLEGILKTQLTELDTATTAIATKDATIANLEAQLAAALAPAPVPVDPSSNPAA